MVIHKCDLCGKEMGRWIKIEVTGADVIGEWTTVGDLIPFIGKKEFCKDCADRVFLGRFIGGGEDG